jgi:hypothetical protein
MGGRFSRLPAKVIGKRSSVLKGHCKGLRNELSMSRVLPIIVVVAQAMP